MIWLTLGLEVTLARPLVLARRSQSPLAFRSQVVGFGNSNTTHCKDNQSAHTHATSIHRVLQSVHV